MKLIAAAIGLLVALQSPGADDVASRLHGYLLAYEPKLSELIADESMRQSVIGSMAAGTHEEVGGNGNTVRFLQSEVAFIGLPGDAGWLGFRRVKTLGRRRTEDVSSLRDALAVADSSDYARAREMLADSARHNLGWPRTTNLPNLPLELLHPRHAKRFSVRIAGQETVRGKKTLRLVFVETFSPTIVKAADGGDLRSIVSAWVEPASGRLWRANVYSRDPRPDAWPFDAVVAVDFSEHKELGLLVPATMKEEFFAGQDRKGTGEARYTNYRRFQTSGRILPQ